MRVKIGDVGAGVLSYAKEHILPAMQGPQLWVGGVILAACDSKIDQIMPALVGQPMVKVLLDVDDKDTVDIDKLIELCKKSSAQNGKLRLNLPLVGAVSLNEDDFDVIGECVKEIAKGA